MCALFPRFLILYEYTADTAVPDIRTLFIESGIDPTAFLCIGVVSLLNIEVVVYIDHMYIISGGGSLRFSYVCRLYFRAPPQPPPRWACGGGLRSCVRIHL